jgi:hypothetical protein
LCDARRLGPLTLPTTRARLPPATRHPPPATRSTEWRLASARCGTASRSTEWSSQRMTAAPRSTASRRRTCGQPSRSLQLAGCIGRWSSSSLSPTSPPPPGSRARTCSALWTTPPAATPPALRGRQHAAPRDRRLRRPGPRDSSCGGLAPSGRSKRSRRGSTSWRRPTPTI